MHVCGGIHTNTKSLKTLRRSWVYDILDKGEMVRNGILDFKSESWPFTDNCGRVEHKGQVSFC